MQNRAIKLRVFIVAVSLLLANSVYAMDMGNMMNPSKWMGGNNNRDRYDDDYDRRGYDRAPGYGYGGAPGYGGGAPGYGYGGAPGYGGGAPGYGYGGAPGYGGGAPGYGYGGAPGYGGGAPDYGYGGGPGYGGGAPNYGYGGTPGYGGAPAYGAPKTESNEAEIMRLKERIRQLEGGAR